MRDLLGHKSFRILLGIVILLAIIPSILYTASLPSVRETLVLATTVQPENFTELYFEDHLNLPKKAEKDADMSFRFTIHNLEHSAMDYPYEMYIEYNGRKQSLEKSSVTLKHDEHRTLLKSIKLIEPVDRARVVINLTEKNQEIAFWVEK